jgi:hypothetical protein
MWFATHSRKVDVPAAMATQHRRNAREICTRANSSQLARCTFTSPPQRGHEVNWLMPGMRTSLTWPEVVCFQPQAIQRKVSGGDGIGM